MNRSQSKMVSELIDKHQDIIASEEPKETKLSKVLVIVLPILRALLPVIKMINKNWYAAIKAAVAVGDSLDSDG